MCRQLFLFQCTLKKMIKVMNFVTCFCLYYYIKNDEPKEMIKGWWVLPSDMECLKAVHPNFTEGKK